MKKDQSKLIVKLAKGLWPEMTNEQSSLLSEKIEPFLYERASAVLKTLAASHGAEFFSMPRTLEALSSDNAKHGQAKRDRATERLIDWIRREYSIAVPCLTDDEAIEYHFTRIREALDMPDIDPVGRVDMMNYARGSAREAFNNLGLSLAHIESRSEAVFGTVNA
jgi:hypothetical protein